MGTQGVGRGVTYRVPRGENHPLRVWRAGEWDGLPRPVAPLRYDLADVHALADGSGVRVGLCSTGVHQGHPELSGLPVVCADFTGGATGHGDVAGCGTAYAHVLLADPSRGWGRGSAPGAELFSAKVVSDDRPYSPGPLRDGLRWLAGLRCDIVVVAAQAERQDREVQWLLGELTAAGVLVVAPVGVGAAGDPGQQWPSKSRSVLAVAGADGAGRHGTYSGTGDDVDVAGWGGPRVVAWPGGRFAEIQGSGLAAMWVAGFGACCLHYRRHRLMQSTLGRLRADVEGAAEPVYPHQDVSQVGAGVVDPRAWLAEGSKLAELAEVWRATAAEAAGRAAGRFDPPRLPGMDDNGVGGLPD